MKPSSRRRLHLFAVALSAFALFVVQPLVGRALMPRLGGTPAVWNAVSTFFQLTLVTGYLLIHLTSRARRGWVGPSVYVGTLLLGALTVGLGGPQARLAGFEEASAELGPVLVDLIITLGVATVGLAMSTPLWSRSYLTQSLGDPYPLFAASNAGSLVALLVYPLLLEPWLGLSLCFDLWRLLLVVLLVLAGINLRAQLTGARAPAVSAEATEVGAETSRAPSGSQRWRWLGLAATASATSLAITAHLTTDLTPTPWLWVLPLAVYLGSWIFAFRPSAKGAGERVTRLWPLVAAVAIVLDWLALSTPTVAVVAAWLVVAGFACTHLHLRVAQLRPPADALTGYYVWISAGGALGAASIAWLAPALFSRNFDLTLVLAAALAFTPSLRGRSIPRGTGRWALVLVGLSMLLLWHATGTEARGSTTGGLPAFAFALWIPLFWPSFRWPRAAALFVAVLALVGRASFETADPAEATARSALSSYRVDLHASGRSRFLSHGRTDHGGEYLEAPFAGWPLPYHHPRSPAADLLRETYAKRPGARVAVLGLGVGAMAYAAPSTAQLDFYELDPLVETLAREHFAFLAGCTSCRVRIGDGRVQIAGSGQVYDLILLDAFSSDAVPLHLLTKEAFESYLERLAPGGLIGVHITNRHVDLRGPLGRLAETLELRVEWAAYDPDRDDALDPRLRAELAGSVWVRLSRRSDLAPAIRSETTRWSSLRTSEDAPLWTDERASLVHALGEVRPAALAGETPPPSGSGGSGPSGPSRP